MQDDKGRALAGGGRVRGKKRRDLGKGGPVCVKYTVAVLRYHVTSKQ
jgi:hypothetical protein